MNGRNFFSELKRRNVYKVAIAYAVVVWLLIQAGSILFPNVRGAAMGDEGVHRCNCGSATPATSISMAAVPLKSTAGLPAVSQSEDKPMYFADGTQDDPLREGSALPKNFPGSESKTIYN